MSLSHFNDYICNDENRVKRPQTSKTRHCREAAVTGFLEFSAPGMGTGIIPERVANARQSFKYFASIPEMSIDALILPCFFSTLH
jgi:hypothetical protein